MNETRGAKGSRNDRKRVQNIIKKKKIKKQRQMQEEKRRKRQEEKKLRRNKEIMNMTLKDKEKLVRKDQIKNIVKLAPLAVVGKTYEAVKPSKIKKENIQEVKKDKLKSNHQKSK